uniref:Uncharacterized protein n=1 Tax=Panagrolaimus davidi TaxID=227884 RepID=A0A914QTW3_9BILA
MLLYFTTVFTVISIYIIMSQEQIGAQIKCQITPILPFQELVKTEKECLNSPLISVKNFDVYGQQLNKNIFSRNYDYYRWNVAVLMVLVFIGIVPLAYFKRVINNTPLAEELLYQEAVKLEEKAD